MLGKEWDSWIPSYAVRPESKDIRRLIEQLYELNANFAPRDVAGENTFDFLGPTPAGKIMTRAECRRQQLTAARWYLSMMARNECLGKGDSLSLALSGYALRGQTQRQAFGH